jgi:PAS domain-containing protein
MIPERLSGRIVSATAFVRNFGAYARTAGGEPIHILNHGRPAWSLIATDQFMRLAAAGAGGADGAQDRLALAMVLDTIGTQVIMTDAALTIVRMNIAARHAFLLDEDAAHGMPLDGVLVDPAYHFMLRAAERVRDTGVGETFELDTILPPLRTFRVQVECFAEGLVIFADDISVRTQVRQRHAIASAYEELMDALPGLARGTINARGVIRTASPALAALVQTDPGRIVGMRIASLFHMSERAAVGDAIETLLGERRPFTLATSLQTGGMATAPVILSAVPCPVPARDEEATFLLQSRDG